MRILLFSDLHGHSFKPYSTTLDNGRNSRLQDAVNILDEIYDACEEYNVDGVLFAGDLFHARGTLQVATFNAIFESIAKIKTRVSFFGMLVGNHDQATKFGNIHACYAFDSVVTVMDYQGWFTFWDGPGDPLQQEALHVYAIPYSEKKDEAENGLKTFGSAQPVPANSICLAHLGISGASVGSNFVLVTEDNLTTAPFTKAGFDHVFLGHYHKHQLLTPNMQYIGATHQHNWGDVGQERGFLLYDTTGGVVHVPTKSAPRFVRVKGSCGTVTSCSGKDGWERGNFVRVEYSSPPDPGEWSQVKTSLLKVSGARWVEQHVIPAAQHPLSSGNVYQPGMDFEDMIKTFVKQSNTGDLDTDLLVQLGKDTLRGVQ